MKKLLLSSVIFIGIGNAHAQALKLLNATEQGWSGGVCCRVGINYCITLEMPDTSHIVAIDTVWIGDRWYTVVGQNNISITKSIFNGKAKYQLFIGESWDTNDYGNITKTQVPPPAAQHSAYKGRACIIYNINGVEKLLSIKNFTQLEGLAYP